MIEGEPTKTYAYTYGNAWKDQLTSFDGFRKKMCVLNGHTSQTFHICFSGCSGNHRGALVQVQKGEP